ncbi:hypothetical protein ACJMK2_026586 [Sinanodonta woodiana]|uniref:Nodal modulator 1 n=1 Tax=Sinanodonta woodiana TaxID=1069815 RepID=A0ABD3XKI3_SINWO
MHVFLEKTLLFSLLLVVNTLIRCGGDNVLGCGGFVKSDVDINFSLVEVKLYTPHGSIKYQTDCAPNTGYYLIPLYDKGDFKLKVEPPQGWSFEPESIEVHIDGTTDKCSLGEDINFVFTGFSVYGKVTSKGQSTGPAGVTLTLSKTGSSEILQTTITSEDGSYKFSQVMPGEYTVRAARDSYRFEKAEATVKVENDNTDVVSNIIIAGYPVKGKVYSEGEPIRGVSFLLFSTLVKKDDVLDCSKGPISGYKTDKEGLLCHETSKDDGGFLFPCLPTGDYSLVPFYKGEHITFDVVPEVLKFHVAHSAQQLEPSFTVTGFSVTGRVMDSEKGSGVAGAKVIVNGKEHTVTNADGIYHLEKMKTGSYKLQVRADHMVFDDFEVKITPNTPQLPDILAAKFSVCGAVVISKVPDGSNILLTKRKLILFPEGKKTEIASTETQEDGTFCVEKTPGKYIIKVHVSDSELKAGLRLIPAEHTVTVVNKPVFDVKFTQFKAQVSGIITCIEKCGPVEMSLDGVDRSEKQIAQARETQKGASFSFENVIPGKYKVTLLRDSWCWKNKTLEFEIIDKNVDDLAFVQTGFILKCTISHSINLNFAQEKEGSVGSFQLNKGKNRFCLAQSGVYKLTPDSCHQFEKDVYSYDTANPETLTLTAVKHLLQGSVSTEDDKANDIIIIIRSSMEKVPITIGPLAIEKPKTNETVDNNDLAVYKFSHWARAGEQLEITAKSSEILFTPDKVEVTIAGDSCPGEVARFVGKKGVFIIGHITPPLGGVNITVLETEGRMEPVSIESDSSGKFRVGPLHSHMNYNVLAEKEGYVLAKEERETASFRAFKLGKVAVQIVGETQAPLPDVLLSLSGGKQYRSNNVTGQEGSMIFNDLSPGQYFLRPMMKEYKFEPSSQMIDVLEGTTIDIKIKGVRVAFSCYGQVTSLNGEPEPGVIVEAMGQDRCNMYQEESKTDQDGQYRIRGLESNCTYEVRLKIGNVNKHIERAAPKSRIILVENSDFQGVNIIAFRRMNQMDISGNVVTDPDYLPSLKVRLFRDDNQGVPIQTVSLGVVSFFYLPSLQIDDQKYTIKLESTLQKTTHDYILPEVSLTANVSYKHVTFKFEPKRKSLDNDLTQSSILVLPLTILVLYAAYNYEKVLPFLGQLANQVQQSVNTVNKPVAENSAASETDPSDSPIQKKKSKPRKT